MIRSLPSVSDLRKRERMAVMRLEDFDDPTRLMEQAKAVGLAVAREYGVLYLSDEFLGTALMHLVIAVEQYDPTKDPKDMPTRYVLKMVENRCRDFARSWLKTRRLTVEGSHDSFVIRRLESLEDLADPDDEGDDLLDHLTCLAHWENYEKLEDQRATVHMLPLVMSRLTRLQAKICLMISWGSTIPQVAKAIGVTESRVSQLRKEIRAVAEDVLAEIEWTEVSGSMPVIESGFAPTHQERRHDQAVKQANMRHARKTAQYLASIAEWSDPD